MDPERHRRRHRDHRATTAQGDRTLHAVPLGNSSQQVIATKQEVKDLRKSPGDRLVSVLTDEPGKVLCNYRQTIDDDHPKISIVLSLSMLTDSCCNGHEIVTAVGLVALLNVAFILFKWVYFVQMLMHVSTCISIIDS